MKRGISRGPCGRVVTGSFVDGSRGPETQGTARMAFYCSIHGKANHLPMIGTM